VFVPADQAASHVADRTLVRKDDARMVLSSDKPVVMQGREVPNVESHDGSAVLATPIKLSGIDLTQAPSFRR